LTSTANKAILTGTRGLGAGSTTLAVSTTDGLSLLVVPRTVQLASVATETDTTITCGLALGEATGRGARSTANGASDLVLGTDAGACRSSETVGAGTVSSLPIVLHRALTIATAAWAFKVATFTLEILDALAMVAMAASEEHGRALLESRHLVELGMCTTFRVLLVVTKLELELDVGQEEARLRQRLIRGMRCLLVTRNDAEGG